MLTAWQATTGLDGHSRVASLDGLFVDAANGDLRLASGNSLAVDAGTLLEAPQTDILGQSRPYGAATDVGAYEYQGDRRGDLNGDQQVNAVDIDLLYAALRLGTTDPQFDLDGNGLSDQRDTDWLVEQILGTVYGDANLDGHFDTADLIAVFQAGKFEDQFDDNAGWAEGDWDGDGDFGTGDLVLALQRGGFEQ
jgi:hypothetical protein